MSAINLYLSGGLLGSLLPLKRFCFLHSCYRLFHSRLRCPIHRTRSCTSHVYLLSSFPFQSISEYRVTFGRVFASAVIILFVWVLCAFVLPVYVVILLTHVLYTLTVPITFLLKELLILMWPTSSTSSYFFSPGSYYCNRLIRFYCELFVPTSFQLCLPYRDDSC